MTSRRARRLPNPDTSRLVQYFAQAYIDVEFDLSNATPVAPFKTNSDTTGDLTRDYKYDGRRSAALEFWQAYVLGAFQPHESEDGDPDSESATVGQVDRIGSSGSGAHIFLEPIRDFGAVEFETVVHEVGHLMGCEHTDLGMMAQSANNEHSTRSSVATQNRP